jgi:hypothetical protein
MPVNINIKTKIIINGKEYSSPDELPPELRKADDQALANRENSPQIQITGSSKATFNGQTYTNRDTMPDEARRIYDSAMEVIDKNHSGIPDSLQTGGNAVLPSAGKSTPMSPLPAQQSPISPDRPGQGRTIITAVVILVVLLAVALFYFGFIR